MKSYLQTETEVEASDRVNFSQRNWKTINRLLFELVVVRRNDKLRSPFVAGDSEPEQFAWNQFLQIVNIFLWELDERDLSNLLNVL